MGLAQKVVDGFLPISPWKFAKLVKYLMLVQKSNVEEIIGDNLTSFTMILRSLGISLGEQP